MGHKDKKREEWPGYYRCDDLVPPLCDDDLTITTGHVETLPGLRVKYWRYTPSNVQAHNKFPIVVINGGPGLPHNYVAPTRNLACDGREVVMYDQAGTGASQPPMDANVTALEYPELFTIDYYAETELPALLDKLGFARYHILASSWGTQIAFQFAVSTATRNVPGEGLQSLILNAPIADNRKFIEYQWDPIDGSVGTLPTFTLNRLKHFNDTQDFDDEEFEALQEMVEETFNARLGVLVDCWLDTEEAGISYLPLDRMMGITDIFNPSSDATIKGWTVLPDLHQVHIPVQLNHGGYDMVRPRLVADTAAELVGHVECHLFPRAAHAIMLDSPEEVYPHMQDFLIRVEDALVHQHAFRANGVCPTGASSRATTIPDDSFRTSIYHHHRHHLLPTTGGIPQWMVLAFSVGISFWFGLWVGTKRNKSYTGGYHSIQMSDPAY